MDQSNAVAGALKGRLTQVDPKSLKLAPCREGEVFIEMEEMKASEFVFLRPPLVYRTAGDIMAVLDGWRAVLKAVAAGVPTIEVMDMGALSDAQALEYVVRTGVVQFSRNPLALAKQMKALADARPELKPLRKMAEFLGCSHTKVRRFHHYLSLSADIQQKMAEGTVTVSEADVLVKVATHPEVQAKLAEGLADGNITREKAEEVAKGLKVSPKRAKTDKGTVVAEAPAASMPTPEVRWKVIAKSIEEFAQVLSLESRKRLAKQLREMADAIEQADEQAPSQGQGVADVA